MTFGGDSERAIEQTQLAIAAAHAIGDDYLAAHYRSNRLTYTALLAPGTDETLRLADEVRHDAERTGSVVLRERWLEGMALALLPVDRGPSAGAARRGGRDRDPREPPRSDRHVRVLSRPRALQPPCATPDAATALRRALVGFHDRGNRRGMTNVLSVRVRPRRPHRTTGDRRSPPRRPARRPRDEFGLPGSANERHAEQRIGEHLNQREELTVRSSGPPARHRGHHRSRARHPRRDRRRPGRLRAPARTTRLVLAGSGSVV